MTLFTVISPTVAPPIVTEEVAQVAARPERLQVLQQRGGVPLGAMTGTSTGTSYGGTFGALGWRMEARQ